jgi:ABC-type amino acid transport substrate-binding protein
MNNQTITSNITYSNIDIGKNPIGKLRVGVVKNAQPHAFCETKLIPHERIEDKDKEKIYKTEIGGIVVKIWENVAKKYKIDYEYICVDDSYNKLVDDVANDKYDIVLGDFSITLERIQKVLFTRAYYIGELRVFRKNRNNFITNIFFNRLLILLFVFFIFIVLLYTLVYKYFKHTSYITSFFIIFGNFFQNNLYLFYPGTSNNFLRFINLSWSFIRFIFFAVIITQMVNIIVQTSSREISEEEMIQVKDILVLDNSSDLEVLSSLGKNPVPVNTIEEAMKKIASSNGDVYWFGELTSTLSKAENINLEKSENLLFQDEMAVIVNKKYPDIVEKIDKTIIEMQDSQELLNICKIYMEDRYDACLL